VDVARSVLDEEAQHGRATGTTVHPDCEWSILRTLKIDQSKTLRIEGY
jgi:hypothetical protein